MLIPHLGYLIVAIVSALATAYLNIEIPQSLGQIVNVVASYVKSSSNAVNEVTRDNIIKVICPNQKRYKQY